MNPYAPRRLAVFAALLACVSAGAVADQPAPRLVADLGDPEGRVLGVVSNVAVFDGRVIFSAADFLHGEEPWISDGSEAGTEILVDLEPGFEGSSLWGDFVTTADLAFFARPDGVWRSDGTAAGTWLLGDVGGTPFELVGLTGSRVVLSRPGAAGVELWASDGSADSPSFLTSFAGPSGVGRAVLLGDVLLFVAPMSPERVWRTDGTAAGTYELSAGGATFSRLVTSDGERVYLVRADGGEEARLWSLEADGTLRDVGLLAPAPVEMATPGGIFFIEVSTSPDQVWFLDTTAAGDGTPRRLPELETSDRTRAVAEVDGVALFRICPPPYSTCELVAWDENGRRVLYEHGFQSSADGVGRVADGVVISTRDELLWTDGYAVRELGPYYGSFLGGAVLADRLYLLGRAGGQTALLATDGSAVGTGVVRTFPSFAPGSRPHELLAPGDGTVWMLADQRREGIGFPDTAVWRSTGTATSTERIASYPDRAPSDLFAAPGRILAPVGAGPLLAYENGREAGTFGTDNCFYSEAPSPGDFAVSAGRAFFRCSGADYRGQHLWTLAPGADEAREVVDADPSYYNECSGPAGCFSSLDPPVFITPWTIGPLAGGVTFAATSSDRAQLWFAESDGVGHRILHSFDTYPRHVTQLTASPSGVAVFAGYQTATGWDVWRTDGTAAGTRALGLFAGEGLAGIVSIVAFDGGAAVVARGASSTDELWWTDGTAAGSRRVSTLRSAGRGGQVDAVVRVGSRLQLVARHPGSGSELWLSDGTEAGTRLLDLVPGPAGSRPHHLTAIGDLLLFAADDGVHGSELWASDGTVAGTRRLTDVAPGRASSDPGDLTAEGGRLFFAAGDAEHGRELWVIDDLPALLAASETCDGPVHCFQDGRFRVAVTWDDDVTTGAAKPVPGASDDSGLFTFFSADNWEILVKVLDGCAIDGSYWVFAAAATHVGYTIEVTDRVTGERRVYEKPYGPPAPALTATGAFACAP